MTEPNSSDESATERQTNNIPINPLTLLGAIGIGVMLFGVQQTSVLGDTCYHFGAASMNTVCLHQELYLGGWIVSVVLLVLGLAHTHNQRNSKE